MADISLTSDDVATATNAFQAFYNIRRDMEQRKARAAQGLADIGEEGRAQQEHQTEQRLTMLEMAASIFARGEQHIDELYPDDPQGQFAARNELFGQVMDSLMPPGATQEQWVGVQRAFVENPGFAAQMAQSIRESESSGGSQANPLAVVDPRTGRSVYVRPQEAVGREPAAISVQQGNLEERIRTGDRASAQFQHDVTEDQPTDIFADAQAQAAGRAAGEAAGARAATSEQRANTMQRLDERIESVLGNPAFEAVVGMPSLRKLTQGGFGFLGAAPGTAAQGALSDFNEVVGEVSSQAMALMEDPRPTDADREAMERALADLDRARDMPSMVAAIRRLQRTMHRANTAIERDVGRSAPQTPAAGTPNPSRPRTPEENRAYIDEIRRRYSGDR